MEYSETKAKVSGALLAKILLFISNTSAAEIPEGFLDNVPIDWFTDPISSQCSKPYSLLKMLNVLDEYKPKSVFDPLANCGERLMACALRNIRYIGCNPNPSLQYYYADILSTLHADPKKFGVISSSFQNADLDMETFDMVCTSIVPEDLQIATYKSKNVWKSNFLYLLLSFSWGQLNEGGILHIELTKTQRYDFSEDLISMMRTYPDASRLNIDGLFVWKKGNIKHQNILAGLTLTAKMTMQQVLKEITKTTVARYAVGRYFKMFLPSTKIHYVASFHDNTVPYILQQAKLRHDENKNIGKTVFVHIPSGDRDIIKIVGGIYEYELYDIPYQEKVNQIKAKITTGAILLDRQLNSPEFESILFDELNLVFSSVAYNPNFVEPDRLWIHITSDSVLKVLARIWKHTTFICRYTFEPKMDIIESVFPYDIYRRMIIYHDSTGMTLQALKTQRGYKTDLIFG